MESKINGSGQWGHWWWCKLAGHGNLTPGPVAKHMKLMHRDRDDTHQLETVEELYSNYQESGQTLVFPRLSIGANAAVLAASITGIGLDQFRYWLHNDSKWVPSTFTYDDILKIDAINPSQANADEFDLSPFHQRGGKLILYHGHSDMLIPSTNTIFLYNEISRTLAPRGIKISEFLRFYLIPGMDHCFGGEVAPWYIGASYQNLQGTTHSVPGFEDLKHDIVLAMMNWVENGVAPEEIIATKFKGDTAGDVERQRPLCTYPARARFVGGDMDAASNWKCDVV
ncbi:feruloyl esterase B precursor [Paramyrothecium foliicola]|nr:feruloyl esterase B precursor [Paramyrothecium foliicola]